MLVEDNPLVYSTYVPIPTAKGMVFVGITDYKVLRLLGKTDATFGKIWSETWAEKKQLRKSLAKLERLGLITKRGEVYSITLFGRDVLEKVNQEVSKRRMKLGVRL